MPLPAAGWFPDPQNADRERWWDGLTWSTATRPALEARVEPAPPAPVAAMAASVAPAGPRFSFDTSPVDPCPRAWASASGAPGPALAREHAQAQTSSHDHSWLSAGRGGRPRRVCVFSWGSLVLALASVWSNPFALVGIAALVLGVAGLVRPASTGGWRVAARSVALSGLVLALATTLIAVRVL